jgi:hypothetical protein
MSVNEFDRAWAEALLDKVFKRRPLTTYEVSVLDAAAAEIGFDRGAASATFDTAELTFAVAREVARRRSLH